MPYNRKKKAHASRNRGDVRGRRRKRLTAAKTTAIVRAEPAVMIQPSSAVPTVHEAVKNMERVRRFVSSCLNIDLQREMRKLAARSDLTVKQKTEEEAALRERLEIDWGTIPGVDKPFLKQPGAEKFLWWLKLRPKFIKREVSSSDGHLEMICSVIFYTKKTNEEVFEGPDCSCSTMESNYRFRYAEHEGPPLPQEETERLKQAGLGRSRKKKIWAHGKFVGEQWVWYDRIENPNIHDERNKVRQIGEKRALVKGVRNMGALSEIFLADPAEWDIPDEDDNPRNDRDYTPSGRRIVIDGKTPSGVPVNPTEYSRSTEPQLTPEQKAIAEQHEAELNRKMDEQLEQAKKEKAAKQESNPQHLAPHQFSASTSQSGAPTPAKSEGAGKPTVAHSAGAPSPALTVGVLQYARPDKTSNKGIECLTVGWGGYVFTCFDKKLFPYLTAGAGFKAELFLSQDKRKIVGIRKIGRREFEEGCLPALDVNEERPTNIAQLF